MLSDNKRITAFPILNKERKCRHPRVAVLQEEGAPANPTINDSIVDPESYVPSSDNTVTKPKNVDEEMYSLLAARELIKKKEMQQK